MAALFGCLTLHSQQVVSAPSGTALRTLTPIAQQTVGQQTVAQQPGTISGTVIDPDRDAIVGALVTLAGDSLPAERHGLADGEGYFSFLAVPPGTFHLTVSSFGFASVVSTVSVHAGEDVTTSEIVLPVASIESNVDVSPASQYAMAQEDIRVQETQRLGGLIPNFYVVYHWHAPPLTAKQKFRLAFRNIIDPSNLGVAAISAGVEQATNSFKGYGQGAQGYGKRFGASMADETIGNMLGGALFPTLFRQDPRYFYKGTGSIISRALYALSTAFICRGDSGKWQPNYSSVAADVATGAVSNLYYPSSDRSGAVLTIENGLLNAAGDGVGNLLQEFLFKHITPSSRNKP